MLLQRPCEGQCLLSRQPRGQRLLARQRLPDRGRLGDPCRAAPPRHLTGVASSLLLSRRGFGGGLLGTALAAAPRAPAQAAEVELLLVLLNDGSGSIDEEEYKLQREGTASAIEHPQVLRSLRGPIAVAYGEWGSPGGAQLILPWTRIAGEDDAGAFA
ncbi:MAG: DUF1194 domain-containing protein, partial [Alphaproteobacteria bacterium]|nr:DUF1194 domain-containing protein [Alphaproteobacteria bacterium]